jgi:hypothetical protein
MIDHRRRTLLLFVVAAASLIACVVLAARLGFLMAERGAELRELSAGEARVAALATPSPPEGLATFAGGPTSRQSARVGEELNVQLGSLGLAVSGVETGSRKPFTNRMDTLFVTVRARGDATAGARALAWLQANSRSVMVEQATAFAGEGVQADWTFKLIVLVSGEERPL